MTQRKKKYQSMTTIDNIDSKNEPKLEFCQILKDVIDRLNKRCKTDISTFLFENALSGGEKIKLKNLDDIDKKSLTSEFINLKKQMELLHKDNSGTTLPLIYSIFKKPLLSNALAQINQSMPTFQTLNFFKKIGNKFNYNMPMSDAIQLNALAAVFKFLRTLNKAYNLKMSDHYLGTIEETIQSYQNYENNLQIAKSFGMTNK